MARHSLRRPSLAPLVRRLRRFAASRSYGLPTLSTALLRLSHALVTLSRSFSSTTLRCSVSHSLCRLGVCESLAFWWAKLLGGRSCAVTNASHVLFHDDRRARPQTPSPQSIGLSLVRAGVAIHDANRHEAVLSRIDRIERLGDHLTHLPPNRRNRKPARASGRAEWYPDTFRFLPDDNFVQNMTRPNYFKEFSDSRKILFDNLRYPSYRYITDTLSAIETTRKRD